MDEVLGFLLADDLLDRFLAHQPPDFWFTTTVKYGRTPFKQGETNMGDKGKKDKGKKEHQKKAQLSPKEKRKAKREKKKEMPGTLR